MPTLDSQSVSEILQGWLETIVVPFVFALISMLVGYIISRYVVSRIKKRIRYNNTSIEGEDPYAKKIADMVGSMVFYVLMIFNILISFQIVGLNVAILMAGISFGIGFAMQTTLANMVSGIMIITNPKIKAGEVIQILGDFDTLGTIEKLSARNCIVRLFDGKKLIIPNKTMVETPIKTFKQEPFIRQEVQVSIDLNADFALAKQVLTQAINSYDAVVNHENTLVNTETVTGEGINLIAYFYVSPQTVPRSLFVVRSDIRKIIHRTLQQHNISIPYPHQVIDIEN